MLVSRTDRHAGLVGTCHGRSTVTRTAIAFCTLLALSSAMASADLCDERPGVYLQVLGSGGPIADDGRASTAYIVRVDGKSRILVDAGGGAFVRFGESGADFSELDHIAISHFHADHAADLVALLKTGYFSDRQRPLGISGPGPGGSFPGLDGYLDSLIGTGGAYAYLSGYLDGSGGLVRLEPVILDPKSRETTPVRGDENDDIEIMATGVPHGIVPTIAYRVRAGEREIVFASDQNGNDDAFIDFAMGADALVMHMAVPEKVDAAGRSLHAPPSRIGQIAALSQARKLVLSHFMARSLRDFDASIALVRERYEGPVIAAEDLTCITVE